MVGLSSVALLLVMLAAENPVEVPLPSLPRIIDALPCVGPAEEIVVCGRRPRTERYRIPVGLREQPMTARDYSWSSRARDEREAGRYEDQVTGPAGAFNRSREIDCRWRAERQQLTGRQVDCARQIPFELTN